MKVNQIKSAYKNIEKRIASQPLAVEKEMPQKGLLSRNTTPKTSEPKEMEPMDIAAAYMRTIRNRRKSM